MNQRRDCSLFNDTCWSVTPEFHRGLRALASPILADRVPYFIHLLVASASKVLPPEEITQVVRTCIAATSIATGREGSGSLSQKHLLPSTSPLPTLCCRFLACRPLPKLWLSGSILGESYAPKSFTLPHTELRL